MNAQLQRRMQVFRTAGLTDVCDQINNQRRPDRGNLTPLQLLALTPQERQEVNRIYTDRTAIPEVVGLRPIVVGNYCRILKMTRKEQEQNKTKGFAPKWSKQRYRVAKKLPIAKNKDHADKQLEEKYTDLNDKIKLMQTWIERQEESKDVKK